ncbi:hypothetical protein QE152_g7154 [Popillia japonica]|uniref:Uncharacterized protein n=1 Tax=Popillia japonica TaxID=7064 RepID=A0AAW1MFZ0_POPJA
MANIGDVIENQTSNAASNNYVTVIPVDYSTNLIYNSQTPDYIVEQYSDFSKRAHDDYIQTEDVQNDQGALYSVSQRVQSVNANYSNACPTDKYGPEQKCSAVEGNWNREVDKPENANAKPSNEKVNNDIDNSPIPPMATANTSTTNENIVGPVLPTCVYLHDRVAIMLEIEDSTSATVDLMCNAIVSADEVGLNKQLKIAHLQQ